jgi:hypothetical protein
MADRENAGLSEITHSRKRLAEKGTILGKEVVSGRVVR